MTQEFEATIEEWRLKVHEQLLGIARQSIYELGFRVVTDTPVDTGFLRGGWQPSIGEIPSAKAAQTFDAGGAMAMADMAVKIAGLKLGDVFYYTNATVYARRIEYGFVGEDSLGRYYNQAGRFYVTYNVAQWGSIVEQKSKELAA